MVPNKLLRVLGYNNLSIILEQERRHWLMKTNRNKQIQDSVTGDMFRGRVDNTGSDIIIESRKDPVKYEFMEDIQFDLENADTILTIALSALPHSAEVNGLMYARIKSINYEYESGGVIKRGNYKIKFTNASECIIPFGGSINSDEVYAGKWIRTLTPPTIMIYDADSHDYTIERSLGFENTVTNAVWYYPLEESLQPFDVTKVGNTYTLGAVDSNNNIGDPLFWFTCDQSNIGSNVTFTNNGGANGTQIMYIANAGNAAPYDAKIYVGVDGHDDATPSGTSINDYSITVSPATGRTFSDSLNDFSIPLNNVVTFKNNATTTTYTIELTYNENDVLTMCNDSEQWTYVDANTYSIPMSYFAINCLASDLNAPLVALLNMKFDQSVPFVKSSTDYGYAGMRFYAGNPNNDTVDRYPYYLNRWEGLPEWLTDPESNTVQEHGVVYAMHNAPTSDPEVPSSLQGSGLIFDPGLVSDPMAEDNPDSKGRVYILSNDGIEYENNRTAKYPKPARTAARICDIPTSAAMLTNAEGLLPTQVVDKKYVRTETSFTVDDKGRIYNENASRWVKPTALTINDVPAYEDFESDNKFVFDSIEELNAVDLRDRNNFRYSTNLNPMVDVSYVDVSTITNGGTGYIEGAQSLCIVGGFSFTCTAMVVADGGVVTSMAVSPDGHSQYIPLNNFDMASLTSGVTDEYGTAPIQGGGSGLKFRFVIDPEYLETILPSKGEYFDDLFALVRDNDGLFIYNYKINTTSSNVPKEGVWTKGEQISSFEITRTNKTEENYGVATTESFMNSVIPKIEILSAAKKNDNKATVGISVLQTANCVNIIDGIYTPVVPALPSNETDIPDNVIDLCKFYCDGIAVANATSGRTLDGVINSLKKMNKIRYDSYVIWRWTYTDEEIAEDTAHRLNALEFQYGIVYRAFSNTFSTDTITKLPRNTLHCDNYVHFNAGTTVVWNVPGVGPMVWMYDATYTKKENYRIDPETMDLDVTRNTMTYADIDVRANERGETVKIVENGKYLWNILSNNPQNVPTSAESTDPMYIDPEIRQMSDCVVGANVSETSIEHLMKGNWRLVFPRVNSYTLTNDATNTKFIAKKLQTIKARNIIVSDLDKVYDDEGNDVSAKTLIISESTEGSQVRVYNSEMRRWDDI